MRNSLFIIVAFLFTSCEESQVSTGALALNIPTFIVAISILVIGLGIDKLTRKYNTTDKYNM